jgi:uncharacterized protein
MRITLLWYAGAMRRIISQKLQKWQLTKGRKPLILYGARQIGKTYILKDFAKHNFPKYHYLNFEEDPQLLKFFEQDLKVDRIIKELSLYLSQSINIKTDLLIFDEIQNCPKALTSLKYFAENIPELALVSAGSLLGLELSPESFPVGKVEVMHMYPMTFMEFLLALGEDDWHDYLRDFDYQSQIAQPLHNTLLSYLKDYFVVGGMPKVVDTYVINKDGSLQVYDRVRDQQEQIIQAVLADVAKHSGKENSMNITQTWQYMPSKLNAYYESDNARFRFKEVIKGKERYKDFIGVLDWLEKANLVIRVPILEHIQVPLMSSMKENIFKLYNYDIGILARLANLSPQRILSSDYGSFKGYFVENFVAQELRAEISHLDSLYSWKTKDHELEFVINDREGRALPIEVKSGKTKTATSFRKFIEKYEPGIKIIYSQDNFSFDKEKSLYRLPLYMPCTTLIGH